MAQNNLNGKVVNLPVLVEVSDISPKIISEGVPSKIIDDYLKKYAVTGLG